jgi:hypothetical protein
MLLSRLKRHTLCSFSLLMTTRYRVSNSWRHQLLINLFDHSSNLSRVNLMFIQNKTNANWLFSQKFFLNNLKAWIFCTLSKRYNSIIDKDDCFLKIKWFDAFIITFRSNFSSSFRIFVVELFNSWDIKFLMFNWLSLRYSLNLIQFVFWVLNFFVIELFTVSISSTLIEN